MFQALPTVRRSEQKLLGALAHGAAFLGLVVALPGMNVLGPLVIWLAHRDDGGFVEDQARTSLNFQISMSLIWLAALPFAFLLVGIPVLILLPIFAAVLVVIAIIAAATGKTHRYPFSMTFVRGPGDAA